jgi:hypothetical protein
MFRHHDEMFSWDLQEKYAPRPIEPVVQPANQCEPSSTVCVSFGRERDRY